MTAADAYATEIRSFLLATLHRNKKSDEIERRTIDRLPSRRILDWWLFEGKRYRGLDAPLAREWARVHRMANALRRTHNPRWSAVQAPEGEVDWIATAFATTTAATPTYVCRASKIGLSADEAEALDGWQSWVARRWARYAALFEIQDCELPWRPTLSEGDCDDARRLRLWAHAARRSRWPLLRNIIAESLRCLLEPFEIDQLPLPTDEAVLFELVCLVRVLKSIAEPGAAVRWLDLEANRNTVQMPGIVARHQHHFGKEAVLETSEFHEPLRRAILLQDVAVPVRADLLVDLHPPRAGFGGILIECKSGSGNPQDALLQLKCYSAAWPRQDLGSRRLILGVTEQPSRGLGSPASARRLAASCAGDLWVFTTAAELPELLESIGLITHATVPAATGRDHELD